MRKVFESIYAVVYTLILSAVCALVVTAANVQWKDAIEEMAGMEKMAAVLRVFGLADEGRINASQIKSAFKDYVQVSKQGGLNLYKASKEGMELGYAFEVDGQGRCGPIRGIMGVNPDRRIVKGLRFYHQEETPGLGGNINSPAFLGQFPGKVIAGPGDLVGLKISKIKPGSINEIDAITGATMTTKALLKILNNCINQFLAGKRLIALSLVLPQPAYTETPTVPPGSSAEPPFGQTRQPLMAPEGVSNLVLNAPVKASDEQPIIGELKMVTDGAKNGGEESFVELGFGRQFVELDLGDMFDIHAILIWHDHSKPIIYKDVVVQVANDADFTQNVRTVFNNDSDNSSELGKGGDREYFETFEGKLIAAKGVKARYVRLYSNGNSVDEMNRYVEIEVYGKKGE